MTEPIQGYNYSCGVGYISIPVDLERDKYIGLCYRSNTVSIRLDDGCFYNNCSISENDIGFIEFPKLINELGTPVVYVSDPIKGNIHIVSVLTETLKIGDKKEGQFKFRRKMGGNVIEIVGDSRKGSLSLYAISTTDSPGNLTISVNNKSTNSKLLLEVGGYCDIIAHKELKLQSFEKTVSESINSKDSSKKTSFTQTSEEVKVETDKFIVSKDKEKMVLGDSLKDLLDSFFNDLSQGKVLTSDGPMPFDPSTISTIQSYRTKLDKILSKIGFLE